MGLNLNHKFAPLTFRVIAVVGLWFGLTICDRPLSAKPSPVIRHTPVTPCPTELDALVNQLLRDLPSYINRVRIRAGITQSYILLAAKPDFTPLPLAIGAVPETTPMAEVKQVFFTTLMRRYEGDRIQLLQEYHWLFLSPNSKGWPSKRWEFIMMYSTLGPYPANPEQPPLPPRNSSEGSVAQAIRDWLIACP